jgi:hypothetical protein
MFLFLQKANVVTAWSDDFQALGVLNKELALRAVVGYNSFCRRTCSMHVAGHGFWLSREFLFALFDYPFRQLDIVQVFTLTAASNERSLKLQGHVGFKPFAIIPRGWDDKTDLIIKSMIKSDCRWLKRKHEQKQRSAAYT